MLLSKLWLFLIAAISAVALAGLLLVPRIADREHLANERQSLVTACDVAKILLTSNAQARVDFATMLAREPDLVAEVDALGSAETITKDNAGKIRTLLTAKLPKNDDNEPDLLIVTDKNGRVVSRLKTDADLFGDVIAGLPLVDQALHGYEVDDVWIRGEQIYLVAAAPIIRRDAPMRYVGSLIMGRAASGKVADKLAKSLRSGVVFTAGGNVAGSSPVVAFDRTALEKLAGNIADDGDCAKQAPALLTSGTSEFVPLAQRLPGEGGATGALATVFQARPQARGLMGTLSSAQKSDLGLLGFPWWLIGATFATLLGVGFALLRRESEGPLRALAGDAVKLAKGDVPRLAEDQHKGVFGSIARSLNIHIDKLGRDATSANANLDSLLVTGDAKLGALDLLGGGAGPGAAPAAPFTSQAPSRALTPPPVEFKFNDPGAKPAPMLDTSPGAPLPPLPGLGGPASGGIAMPSMPTPPPVRAKPPVPQQKMVLDDLVLDDDGGAGNGGNEAAHFDAVYQEFLRVRTQCGEGMAGLSPEKFREKLIRNRDDLMAKTGCASVKFSVYVKDGKAALKASPVKT